MRETVRDSFLAVRGDRSPDAVIADLELNERFLGECRVRGLSESPAALNQCLLNLRKGGDLKGLKSTRVRLSDQENYRFASEIAARFLERRDQITLDQIVCDPAKAAEFDAIAADMRRDSARSNSAGPRSGFGKGETFGRNCSAE